jgi:hypothetical protein
MSTVSVSIPKRAVRPPILLRAQPAARVDATEKVALASDPDWEEQFPAAKTSAAPRQDPPNRHPASRQDFRKLEEWGHMLEQRLGWGPLQGVAIRESGQIAAQRYGYSTKTDAQLAEEAFSLLLAAI